MSAIDNAPAVLPILQDDARDLLFREARSANSFLPTPVSDEQLKEIWELTKWGPTAANTQPLRVLYVRQGEGRDRLVKLMAEGNQAKTASAPAVAVLAVDTSFHEYTPTTFPMRPEMKDSFEADPEGRASIATLSGHLQAGYFIMAVRAVGLAAGPMGGFDAAGVDKEFFPGNRYKSFMVVNLGHPAEGAWFDRLPRLGHDTVVSWA